MKAERRHELQDNTLARKLQNLPVALQFYADKILLGIVIILAIIVLVRWRINAGRERARAAADALASARTSILALSRIPPIGPAQQLADYRNQLRNDAETALRTISADAAADDTRLRSEALLAKADLLWTLANLPDIPGAATQPVLRLTESRDDLLKQAEETYQQILKNYPAQPRMKASALFGLAAIAEDRRNFDLAAEQYNQVKQSDAEEMYKQLADARLRILPDLRQPLVFGSLTTRPAELSPPAPTTSTQPATAPSTRPTTQPVG
jgi:tetratricopeptide (TPR) repeat protein